MLHPQSPLHPTLKVPSRQTDQFLDRGPLGFCAIYKSVSGEIAFVWPDTLLYGPA